MHHFAHRLAAHRHVAFELQQQVQRVPHHLRFEPRGVEQQDRPRPVNRFADRGKLAQIEPAQLLHEADELAAQTILDAGDAAVDDLLLELGVGVADVQMQATPLHRVAKVARVVRRQDDDGLHDGSDGANLGDRHLVVRENFQQEGLEFLVRLVDLVDQQDGALGLQQGLE